MRAGSNSCIVLRGHSHQSHTGRGQWVGGGWVGGGGGNTTSFSQPSLCAVFSSLNLLILCAKLAKKFANNNSQLSAMSTFFVRIRTFFVPNPDPNFQAKQIRIKKSFLYN